MFQATYDVVLSALDRLVNPSSSATTRDSVARLVVLAPIERVSLAGDSVVASGACGCEVVMVVSVVGT